MNTKCPFCHPDRGILPESELSLAVFDKYPVTEGHTLVIPRRHVASYFDLLPQEKEDLWQLVEEVKIFLEDNYHPDGFNVGFNVNECAGQTIFHVHIHVIPRRKGDMENPRGGVRHVIPEKGGY